MGHNWINANELLGKDDKIKFKYHPVIKEILLDNNLMCIGCVDPKHFKKMILSMLEGSFVSRIPINFKYGNLVTYEGEFQLNVTFDRAYVEGEDGESYACFPMAVQMSWYISNKDKVEVIFKDFVVY